MTTTAYAAPNTTDTVNLDTLGETIRFSKGGRQYHLAAAETPKGRVFRLYVETRFAIYPHYVMEGRYVRSLRAETMGEALAAFTG